MKNQKQLALALLDYHGGQNSALYAIGRLTPKLFWRIVETAWQ